MTQPLSKCEYCGREENGIHACRAMPKKLWEPPTSAEPASVEAEIQHKGHGNFPATPLRVIKEKDLKIKDLPEEEQKKVINNFFENGGVVSIGDGEPATPPPAQEELRKLADYVDTVHGPNGVNAWAEKHLPVSPMSEECDSIQDCGSLTKDVNRVEVINHTRDGEGREYVWWPKEGTYDVSIAIQDNGRTLKVFIRNHLSAEETEK